jgi:hypothetical protein
VGSAYKGKINQIEYPHFDVYKNLNAKQVASLMSASSVGLFPASSIAIEAIAMRLPFFAGYFVENQRSFYNFLISSNLAKPLGNFQNIGFNNFKNSLVQLMDNLPFYKNKYKDLIDLKSPDRFVEIFKNLGYEK